MSDDFVADLYRWKALFTQEPHWTLKWNNMVMFNDTRHLQLVLGWARGKARKNERQLPERWTTLQGATWSTLRRHRASRYWWANTNGIAIGKSELCAKQASKQAITIQTVDRPKDWYKSMFKVMHRAGRSGYVGDLNSDYDAGNHSLTSPTFFSEVTLIKQVPTFTLENDSGTIADYASIVTQTVYILERDRFFETVKWRKQNRKQTGEVFPCLKVNSLSFNSNLYNRKVFITHSRYCHK